MYTKVPGKYKMESIRPTGGLVNRHRPISVVRSIQGGAEEHVGLAWESGSPRVRKAQHFIVDGLVLVIFGVGKENIISVGGVVVFIVLC